MSRIRVRTALSQSPEQGRDAAAPVSIERPWGERSHCTWGASITRNAAAGWLTLRHGCTLARRTLLCLFESLFDTFRLLRE